MAGQNKISLIIQAIDRTTGVVRRINGSIASIAAPARQASRGLQGLLVQSGFYKMKTAAAGVSKAIHGVAAASFVAGGALASMGYALKRVSDSGEDAVKNAKRFGTTVTEWQRLDYAASAADVSSEELGSSLNTLGKNAVNAATGSEQAALWFHRAGVNVRDANGKIKPSSQILSELADKFEKMPDGIKKTAIAQALMKNSSKEMIEFLSGGSKEIKKAGDEAERKGLIDDKAAHSGRDFNSSLKSLMASARGVANTIGGALFPSLTKMMGPLTEWIDRNRELIAQNMGHVVAVLAGLIAGQLTWSIVMLTRSVATLGLVTALTPFGWWMTAIVGIVSLIYIFRNALRPLGNELVGAFSSLGELFSSLFSALKELWSLLAPAVIPVLKVLANIVGVALRIAFESVLITLRLIVETITASINLVAKLISGIGTVVSSAGGFRFNQALAGVAPVGSAFGPGGGAARTGNAAVRIEVVGKNVASVRTSSIEANGVDLDLETGYAHMAN